MASSPLGGEIEELTLCSCCRRAFDSEERAPKLLACKHHFCLQCARTVLGAGRDVCCAHCWKRTELPRGRADHLPTHLPVLALARRLAAVTVAEQAVPGAARAPLEDAAALEARALALDARRLAARRRDFLLRALDAATALKMRLEAELANPLDAALELCPSPPGAGGGDAMELERLRARHAELQLQCRLDEAVRGAEAPLHPELVRRVTGATPASAPGEEARDPLLFLANYCTALVYARRGSPPSSSASLSPPQRQPSPYPLYYLSISVDGAPAGRVVVELRSDVAPRMAHNFALLAGADGGGYRGCSVFQCWEGESVIAGDVELNSGRGGRSALASRGAGGWFVPEDSRLGAVRGAVGMRRAQRRHDSLGPVGSQFRIVLREMRGFTAIFGFVAEGLELVDRLSRLGDGAGKPRATILISDCGRLN